jgi:hypothetical protein
MKPFKSLAFATGLTAVAAASLIVPPAVHAAISQPANSHNSFIDSRMAFLPTINGVYIKAWGREFFYGCYTQTGRPAFVGSLWEVAGSDCSSSILAHGYGQTPGWVWGLVRQLFG